MKNKSQLGTDFERLGYETGLRVQDEDRTKAICAQYINSLEDELRPLLAHLERAIAEARASAGALVSQLYDRPAPVRDGNILGRLMICAFAIVMLIPVVAASLIGHSLTFMMLGWSVFTSVPTAIGLTAIATAAGHLLYSAVVEGRRPLILPALVCAGIAFYSLTELAQARNAMTRKAAPVEALSPNSFVDDAGTASPPEDEMRTDSSFEAVERYLGQAITKMMIVADALSGLLLGMLTSILTDPDVVMWRKLRRLKSHTGDLMARRDAQLSILSRAKRACTAGILRALQPQPKHPPFLQVLALIASVLGTATVASAQTDIRRHEAILIDLSGSVSKRSGSSDLFREYFNAVRTLLANEPQGSRVWVEGVTTESFGSVQTLLRGWTPTPKGVFTEPLQRARQQLVASLEAKFAGIQPTAAGTDLLGALARTKVLMESDGGTSNRRVSREIYVLSDMVNESGDLAMPALAPRGAARMMEVVTNNRMLVPLPGYRVHVLGASPAGLTPQLWNEVREFWRLYFAAAGWA